MIASDPLLNDRPVLVAVSSLPAGVEPVPRSDSSTDNTAVPDDVASRASTTVMVWLSLSPSPSPSVAATVNDNVGSGVESRLMLAAKLQLPLAFTVSVPAVSWNTADVPPGSVTNWSGCPVTDTLIDATSSAPSLRVHDPFSVPPSATLSVTGEPSGTAATISMSG